MKKETVIKLLTSLLVISILIFMFIFANMKMTYDKKIKDLENELKVEHPLIEEDTSFIYVTHYTSRTSGEELEFTCYDTYIIITGLKDVKNVTFFINFYDKNKLIIQSVNKTFGTILKGENAIIDFKNELNSNSIKNATQFRVAKINYSLRKG